MRKIREVLRLKAEGFSDRQIAASIGSARSTVQECLHRARDAGITWPLPPEMDEAALQEQMYRRVVPLSQTPRPDFAYLHAELRRRGATRLLPGRSTRARIRPRRPIRTNCIWVRRSRFQRRRSRNAESSLPTPVA